MENTMLIAEDQQKLIEDMQFANSLSGLCELFGANNLMGNGFDGGDQLSQTDTLFHNLRWYLVSNLRQLLSEIYVEYGLVKTLIDLPVDDAFAPGFEVKSSQLSKEEIDTLMQYLEEHHVVDTIKSGLKWRRLFGGGGLLFIVPQDYTKPLNVNAIKENTPLEIRAVDMWELFFSYQVAYATLDVGGKLGDGIGDHYDYYGLRVHKSRVIRLIGKEAPSFIRPRLRGWGLSEVEAIIRPLNQFLKYQDVVFELLDEAKVDVYGLKNYNNTLLKPGGSSMIAKQIQMTNRLKNFNNAIIRDKDDEYEQKQMAFAGLPEIMQQSRQSIAGELKIPMSKLFGIGSTGFSSGEDDIENYNTMLNSEIRSKDKFVIIKVLKVICQKLFGMIPDDLTIDWNPLRVLNAEEEEKVKDSKFNRVMSSFQSGLVDGKTSKQAINKGNLLDVEVDENSEVSPPIDANYTSEQKDSKSSSGKQAPKIA